MSLTQSERRLPRLPRFLIKKPLEQNEVFGLATVVFFEEGGQHRLQPPAGAAVTLSHGLNAIRHVKVATPISGFYAPFD